jgi:hypothetical protein
MKESLIPAMLVVISTEAAVGCADGGACAVVKKTPDNFVALRETVSDCEQANWQRVECVPRLDGDCSNATKRYTSGWVNKSLIKLTACPMNMD